MNAFNLDELWNAACQNPALAKPFVLSKYSEARYARAKARWAKRKAKRKQKR